MRVKSGVTTRQRKKKTFRISKGYYSDRNHRWRMAIQQVEKSLRHAYVGRKDKKGELRQTWITRVNAAARLAGISYSQMIKGLKLANVQLNRKMLSEIAILDSSAFNVIAEIAKNALKTPS